MLHVRAQMLQHIRRFFAERDVLEVETPILSTHATTDPLIESFSCDAQGPWGEQTYYLHTSPEFAMKRLLAAGSGPIYQICKVFRQGEFGRRHNPEFTMLEWYRPGWSARELMDEVAHLVREILPQIPPEIERITYAEAFKRFADVDPQRASNRELQHCARRHHIPLPASLQQASSHSAACRDDWLHLIMSTVVEPHLGQTGLCFVYDYPASQAALARIREAPDPVAERFELYYRGQELANGFQELTDADEQAARFRHERIKRREQGLPDRPQDEYLLAALRAGLPDCAGVAVGLDRLLQLRLGTESLSEVLSFPFDRA